MFRIGKGSYFYHVAGNNYYIKGLASEEHIQLNRLISEDIYDNECRFERNLVGMFVKVDKRLKLNE